jgi:RNA polymerase-binding transcription factor DksA
MATKEVKTRYSDKELEEFRQLINVEITLTKENKLKYEKLIKRIDNENTTNDTFKSHNPAEGEDENFDFNLRMLCRSNEYLGKLNKALERIDLKTYGVDYVTGRLIPKEERLLKSLVATTSVETKKMLEKQGF